MWTNRGICSPSGNINIGFLVASWTCSLNLGIKYHSQLVNNCTEHFRADISFCNHNYIALIRALPVFYEVFQRLKSLESYAFERNWNSLTNHVNYVFFNRISAYSWRSVGKTKRDSKQRNSSRGVKNEEDLDRFSRIRSAASIAPLTI